MLNLLHKLDATMKKGESSLLRTAFLKHIIAFVNVTIRI